MVKTKNLDFSYTANTYSGMTAEWRRINVISLMWDTWKIFNPGLQFFHVSHIRKITLIWCHSAVCIYSASLCQAICSIADSCFFWENYKLSESIDFIRRLQNLSYSWCWLAVGAKLVVTQKRFVYCMYGKHQPNTTLGDSMYFHFNHMQETLNSGLFCKSS